MHSKLWDFYIKMLQGHPSPCVSSDDTTADNINKQIKKYFKDKQKRVLVLGCGDGKEVEIFRELGFNDVTGITLDHTVPGKVPGVVHADMHDLTMFEPESFRYVYCNQTFEHSFAPFILCLEVWTIMEPFGKWYIRYPAKDPERSKLTDPMTSRISHHHPSMLSFEDATTLFDVTGFNVFMYSTGKNETFLLNKVPYNVLASYGVHQDVISTLKRRIKIKRVQ